MKATVGTILLLSSAAVQAQSAVKIYGIADAAIVGESGGSAGRLAKVTSGAAAATRIGLSGSEPLGAGMAAFFTLEMGVKLDTGETDAPGTLFNRQALVGLKGAMGTVALGRQYTPYHTALVKVIDPFSTGYAGTAKNLFPHRGSHIRTSNTVSYASPRWNGWDVELAYAAGEQASASAGRQIGGAIGFASGPLTVRLAYNSKNSNVAATATTPAVDRSLGRNTLLGANYDFGLVKLHAGYGVNRGDNSSPLGAAQAFAGAAPTPSTDSRDLLLGVTARAGTGTVMFSVMHKDDRTSVNQDAHSWGLGYLYHLSKSTGLYAAYAQIRNRNGAGYTVANNTEAGTGDRGYNLGLRYTF